MAFFVTTTLSIEYLLTSEALSKYCVTSGKSKVSLGFSRHASWMGTRDETRSRKCKNCQFDKSTQTPHLQ